MGFIPPIEIANLSQCMHSQEQGCSHVMDTGNGLQEGDFPHVLNFGLKTHDVQFQKECLEIWQRLFFQVFFARKYINMIFFFKKKNYFWYQDIKTIREHQKKLKKKQIQGRHTTRAFSQHFWIQCIQRSNLLIIINNLINCWV